MSSQRVCRAMLSVCSKRSTATAAASTIVRRTLHTSSSFSSYSSSSHSPSSSSSLSSASLTQSSSSSSLYLTTRALLHRSVIVAADDAAEKKEEDKVEAAKEDKQADEAEPKAEEGATPAAAEEAEEKKEDEPEEHPNPRLEAQIPWDKIPDVDIYANPPSAKVLQAVELVQTMTMKEMAEFIQTMQLLTGVDDVMLGRQPADWEAFDTAHGGGVGEYVAPEGGGGGGGGGGAEAEAAPAKQTSFSVKLTGFDAKQKIKVIKEIRSLTGAGLKEAKEIVEAGDAIVKEGLTKDLADEMAEAIKAVGGEVELV